MRRLPFTRLATASLAFALVATGFAGRAAADPIDLFATPTAAQRSAADAAPADASEARVALAALNTAALGDRPAAAKELRIKLFSGVVATFKRDRVEAASRGGEIWFGSANAEDKATLLFDAKGALTGQVALGDKIFSLAPAGGRLQKISETAIDKLPNFGPIRPAPVSSKDVSPDKAAGAGKKAAAKTKDTVVNALFVYSELAKATSPDIIAELDLAVAQANVAFKEAGIRIRPIGMIGVDGFSETASTWEQTLDDITANRGVFSGVRKTRNATKADLVVMIRQPVDADPYCGLAWYVRNPNYFTSTHGFSVVGRGGCLSIHALPHELGHNFGLHHDRHVIEPQPPTDYQFGYVNLTKRVEDIMSYPNACTEKGFSCKRWNGFSDPTQLVRKRPFGVGAGNRDAADAVRRLRETGVCIADYR
ncbi:zinc-dependent metalloprotease family protein [Methylopila sp. M107]|uniref:zinc-dependent metalloprotease family protein n=1 Tax=Methylopila sp. M107 TaxID=1101190 RepID=UPI000368E5B9|nr:zinc-dependent metalloprotease family protein [Methylopila sp. M107]